MDLNVFKEILSQLGFGDITDQDVQTLIDTADMDGDGRVSLNDFRRMLPSSNQGGAAASAAASNGATQQ
jgi:Ca2+-binding EF-hand superfamily protein